MKKIVKFLSISVLTMLMASSLALSNDVEKLNVRETYIDGAPNSSKIIKKANTEPEFESQGLISDVKVQISEEQEGKRNIRFIVGIDSNDYDEAGFIFSNGVSEVTKHVRSAYTGIQNGESISTPFDVFETNDFNYFIAYAIKDIPIIDFNERLNVRAFVKNESKTIDVESNDRTTCVQEIVDLENPPMTNVDLTLANSDCYAGWSSSYLKVRWGNALLYADLLLENITLKVEYDGTRFTANVTGGDGTSGIAGSLAGMGFTGNTAVSFMYITVEIIHENTFYSMSFHVKNNAVYTIITCQDEAIAELGQYIISNEYIENKYEDVNWIEFNRIKNQAIENIENATTFEDVATILQDAKNELDGVEQKDLDLGNTKEIFVIRLTDYISNLEENWYTSDNWDLINSIGLVEIEAAEDEEAVEDAYNQALLDIDAIEKNYDTSFTVDLLQETGGSGLTISIGNLLYTRVNNPKFISVSCVVTLSSGEIYISTDNDGVGSYNTTYTKIVPKAFKLNGTGSNMPRGAKLNYSVELIIEDNAHNLLKFNFDVSGGVYDIALWRLDALANIDTYFQENAVISSLYEAEDWKTITQAKLNAQTIIPTLKSYIDIENALNQLKSLIESIEKIDSGLDGDKLIAKTNLNNYFNTLKEKHYSADDWTQLVANKDSGLTNIDNAEDVEEIKNEYDAAIASIVAINETYDACNIIRTSRSGTTNLRITFGYDGHKTADFNNACLFKLYLTLPNGSIFLFAKIGTIRTSNGGTEFDTNGYTYVSGTTTSLNNDLLNALNYTVELTVELTDGRLLYTKYQILEDANTFDVLADGKQDLPINNILYMQ